MHFGKNNPKKIYTMNNETLPTTVMERDLGVIITPQLNFKKHIDNCVKKANRMIGLISRAFKNKSESVIKQLYITIVRPYLDYCSPLWSPHAKGDIQRLERVQRRATKLVSTLRHLQYDDRLKALGLKTLEVRRKRQDLIQLFKILKGEDYFPINEHFELQNSSTRGHRLKLKKTTNNNDISKHRYCSRIIGAWNSLPSSLIEGTTKIEFIKKLDVYLETHDAPYFVND